MDNKLIISLQEMLLHMNVTILAPLANAKTFVRFYKEISTAIYKKGAYNFLHVLLEGLSMGVQLFVIVFLFLLIFFFFCPFRNALGISYGLICLTCITRNKIFLFFFLYFP